MACPKAISYLPFKIADILNIAMPRSYRGFGDLQLRNIYHPITEAEAWIPLNITNHILRQYFAASVKPWRLFDNVAATPVLCCLWFSLHWGLGPYRLHHIICDLANEGYMRIEPSCLFGIGYSWPCGVGIKRHRQLRTSTIAELESEWLLDDNSSICLSFI